MLATNLIFKKQIISQYSISQIKQVCWLKGVFVLPVCNHWAKESQRFQLRRSSDVTVEICIPHKLQDDDAGPWTIIGVRCSMFLLHFGFSTLRSDCKVQYFIVLVGAASFSSHWGSCLLTDTSLALFWPSAHFSKQSGFSVWLLMPFSFPSLQVKWNEMNTHDIERQEELQTSWFIISLHKL